MMGAGKSSVGRALAELASREFVDTDLLIQARFGRTVAQVFQIYGEQAFRQHETSVLCGLEPTPVVLATGGGIVMREENWREFHRLGQTIYLQAQAETLLQRLGRSKKRRPLLECEDWESKVRNLLAERDSSYGRADIIVHVDDIDVEQASSLVFESVRRC